MPANGRRARQRRRGKHIDQRRATQCAAKPDTIYKVVNTKDGYLTLTEIEKTEGSAAQ